MSLVNKILKEGIQLNITKEIKKLSLKYINEHSSCNSTYDINNGFCEDFADELCAIMTNECFTLSGDMFFNMREPIEELKQIWQGHILETKFGAWSEKMIQLYGGLPPVDLRKVDDEINHTWVYYKGKHYDAECPQGVKKWFDIPLCKKFFNRFK